MKFKIDENLLVEFVDVLRAAHHDALTVYDQGLTGTGDAQLVDICTREERILVTLDLDFADIRAYIPQKSAGVIVLRPHRQDKGSLLNMLRSAIPYMDKEPLKNHLWIVEENRIRIYGNEAAD